METVLTSLPVAVLAGAFAVTFFAGVVKGAVGFGMPLLMVALMGVFMDPKLVIAALIVPIVISNGVQVLRSGLSPALSAARDFRNYIAVVCITILITAQFVTIIPTRVMMVVLGVPVAVLCAVQLAGWRPRIAPEHRRRADWGVGALSGAIGGFAGTWGPTTVLYLVALDTPKERQVAVQGVIYGMGSLMLLIGHLRSGVLNWQTVPLSALLVAPALIGMRVGFVVQDRIDQQTFRRATLFVLLIAGLNLIRRGVFA